ncbi:unnamed protein product, partial [marine sediment metagenome]
MTVGPTGNTDIGCLSSVAGLVKPYLDFCSPVVVDAVQRTAEVLAKTPDPAWTPWVEKAQVFVSKVERTRMTLPQVREALELLASSAA